MPPKERFVFTLVAYLLRAMLVEAGIVVMYGNGSTSSSTQKAITASESFGSNEFDVSAEPVRLRPDDWDTTEPCKPTFVGNLTAVAGKIVVGHPDDWARGLASFDCEGTYRTTSRLLADLNVTAMVWYGESAAKNPVIVPGFDVRILADEWTRNPEDLQSVICVRASFPGPLVDLFLDIPDTAGNTGVSSSRGDETEGQAQQQGGGRPLYFRIKSGDTNSWVTLWDSGPWHCFQVRRPFI